MSRRLRRSLSLPCLAASLLPAVAPALGAETEGLDVHGYLRAGAGSVAGGDGRQACFSLPGAGAKYRLGNECETYGELSVGYKLVPAEGRPGWRYLLMLNAEGRGEHGLGNVAAAARNIGRPNQTWLALDMPASGSGILDGAHVWLGRRFYRREDVHINDFFYWNNSGRGVGVEDLAVGSAKFAYALRRDEGDGPTASDGRRVLSHDFRLYGLKNGDDGELTLGFDYKHAEGGAAARGLDGYWLNALYFQDRGPRGFNKFAVQYGRGAGAGLNGHAVNSSNTAAWTRRLVEQFMFQPRPSLSGMVTAIYQDAADSAGAKTRWWSVGARPIVHFDQHWNFATEIGHDRFRADPDAGTRKLTKLTFALQYSADRGFFARPVVRLFATRAWWNGAAQAAADAGTTLSSSGEFGSRTRGSTVGVQFETWF